MGNKGLLSPNEFMNQYLKFSRMDSTEAPLIVNVFPVNGIYKLYMYFRGILYCTRVAPDVYSKIRPQFIDVVMLSEDMV